jgi:dTDP-4-dehydrorhamnose 3,5-epimerase
MPFEFEDTALPNVILIRPQVFPDHRGYFSEGFKASAFKKQGLPQCFVQDNLSRSVRGILRGLHYQLQPHAQGKLIYVLQGEIYDVAVDIQERSPTFGKWIGNRLSSDNHLMLYIPEGFAHGFQVLSKSAVVVYKLTAEYAPEFESGIIWNDPRLAIPWPIENPILSDKDKGWPRLDGADMNFIYQEDES